MNAVDPTSDHDLMTVVFDFDGVLATNMWPDPKIGEPIAAGIDLAWQYFRKGYQVTVYTARPESHKTIIRIWLLKNNLPFVYDVVCGKPLAAIYVDDRAMRFPDAFEEKNEQDRQARWL